MDNEVIGTPAEHKKYDLPVIAAALGIAGAGVYALGYLFLSIGQMSFGVVDIPQRRESIVAAGVVAIVFLFPIVVGAWCCDTQLGPAKRDKEEWITTIGATIALMFLSCGASWFVLTFAVLRDKTSVPGLENAPNVFVSLGIVPLMMLLLALMNVLRKSKVRLPWIPAAFVMSLIALPMAASIHYPFTNPEFGGPSLQEVVIETHGDDILGLLVMDGSQGITILTPNGEIVWINYAEVKGVRRVKALIQKKQ